MAHSIAFFDHSRREILTLQAVSLGLLVVIGSEKALHANVPFFSIIALGMIAAIAGGAILDALFGVRTALLSQGQWHILALAAGAVGFVVMFRFTTPLIAEIGTVVAVVALRLFSAHHGWKCPEFPNSQKSDS